MKLLDVNVWLALVLSGHAFHDAVRRCLLVQRLDGTLLFCRSTQQSLLRLLTTSAVLGRFDNLPLTNAEAWQVYQGLLGDSRVAYAAEPQDLDQHWQRLAVRDAEASLARAWTPSRTTASKRARPMAFAKRAPRPVSLRLTVPSTASGPASIAFGNQTGQPSPASGPTVSPRTAPAGTG